MSLAALLISGCGEKSPEHFLEDKPLFEYASKLFADRQFTEAIPYFESLRNRFPHSPYAIESGILIADAHFEKRDYLEAQISYQSFRTLHPTNERIPYVMYRTGRSHYERTHSSVARDQEQTEHALRAFEELTARWPDTTYAAEARPLIEKCRRALIRRDLYVADFYLRHRHYEAALLRLSAVERTSVYDDLRGEAQYKMGFAYFRLDKPDEARPWLEKAEANPGAGKYARKASQLRKRNTGTQY